MDLLTSSDVAFLSPIAPCSQIPSNPASPDEPPSLTLLTTSQPPTINTDVAPSIFIGPQLPISSPEVNQSEDTSELPTFSSLLSDVRPLLSRPNQLKLRPDSAVLGRQHRREYYTNHARRTRLAIEVSSYTSITAGIHSHYFFLYDKIRQLEPGNSDVIVWKIPSVKFVFDSAKVARPSSDPLIEPTTSFSSPIFRTHPHGYNFFIKLYPYGIGPATGKCASVLFALFPGDYDNLLQWPFTKTIHIGIRDQLDPMNTWTKTILPDQDPAYKKPTMSTKTGVATILINNFIPHYKLFSETEGFLIDGASFVEIKFSDPPVLKPHTQTSLLFPFP